MNNSIVRNAERDRPSSGISFEALENRRLLSAGTLDTTFGDGGVFKVVDAQHLATTPSASAQQADGKVLVVGTATTATGKEGVAIRLNTDRSVDATFNTGSPVELSDPGYYNFDPKAVAIDGSGRIVVAGSVTGRGGKALAAVVRLQVDGSVDPSFGGNGWETLPFGNNALVNAVAVDSGGRVILGGSDRYPAPKTYSSFAFARLTSAGSIDPSFGRRGYVTVSFSNRAVYSSDANVAVTALSMGGNGTIVAVGGGEHYAIARLRSDGSLDRSFGGAGKLMNMSSAGSLTAVTLSPAGEIYATAGVPNSVYAAAAPFVVEAVTARGKLDVRFQGGQAAFSAEPASPRHIESNPDAITLGSDGDLYVSGSAIRDGSLTGIFLAKITATGVYKPDFGRDGTAVIETQGDETSASVGVFQVGDRLIVPYDGDDSIDTLSDSVPATRAAFRIVSTDLSGHFADAGSSGDIMTLRGPIAPGDNAGEGLSVTADGRIYFAGVSDDDGLFFKRFDSDGSLDQTFADTQLLPGYSSGGQAVAHGAGVVLATGSFLASLRAFNSDGSVDTSFGTDGSQFVASEGEGSGPSQLAALPGGSLLTLTGYGDSVPSANSTISIYNASGQQQSSISDGYGGSFTGGSLFSFALPTPDGKVLAGVNIDGVRRYNADLTLDTTYGQSGTAALPPGLTYRILAVVGLGGDPYLSADDSVGHPVLLHLLANGSLDPDFGTAGVQPLGAEPFQILVQPDGKLIVVFPAGTQLSLTRLNDNGSTDTTFGNAGTATIDLGERAGLSGAALQTIGGETKLIVGGTLYASSSANDNLYVGGTEAFVARIEL